LIADRICGYEDRKQPTYIRLAALLEPVLVGEPEAIGHPLRKHRETLEQRAASRRS
jgi:hypothetical protein